MRGVTWTGGSERAQMLTFRTAGLVNEVFRLTTPCGAPLGQGGRIGYREGVVSAREIGGEEGGEARVVGLRRREEHRLFEGVGDMGCGGGIDGVRFDEGGQAWRDNLHRPPGGASDLQGKDAPGPAAVVADHGHRLAHGPAQAVGGVQHDGDLPVVARFDLRAHLPTTVQLQEPRTLFKTRSSTPVLVK